MHHAKKSVNYKVRRRIVIGLSFAILALLYLFRNINYLILSLSAIALILVFYITDHSFDIRFKTRHYVFITFIAVAGFLLYPLYSIYPSYDKFLHFVEPIMLSSFIFHMVSHLNLKFKWRLIFTFFIVIGFVGLFEIGEYTLDYFFDLKLQGVFLRDLQNLGETLHIIQDPLNDTMIDMSLGVLGALTYLVSMSLFFRKSS